MSARSLIVLVSLIVSNVYAQTIPTISPDLFKANSIPDSLKTDADAVVRFDYLEILIKAPGKAQISSHRILTILNDKADEGAQMVLFYDKKFNSISEAEMVVYDASGNQIKKYRKSDMYDRSATDGTSIITDDRLLAVGHDIGSYPITIETRSVLNVNSFINLPEWQIQTEDHSVQNKYLMVSVPSDMGFRYKNKNSQVAPVKNVDGALATYRWEVHNLKPLVTESNIQAWKITPKVVFATSQFEYNGLRGDIGSWSGFGSWIQNLNADVSSLTPEREEEIRQLTAGLKTEREKAKFLYDYMQKNVRYVSVQLGIGGLKPFPATFVDQKKYGDCKALSNYMRALLRAVNITSYYALVKAGENGEPADPAFSNNEFNHVILCIPFKNDTTWLECTSNTQPFGKLGTFTENRNALLITEAGGVLINTPRSLIEDNQLVSHITVNLDESGGASAKVQIEASGEFRSLYNSLSAEKTDDQKKYMIRSLNLKPPTFIDIQHGADSSGFRHESIEVKYDKYCDIITGDKRFYKSTLVDLWPSAIHTTADRKQDYYFEHPFKKTSVTLIKLPDGFETESLPGDTDLKFTHGSYKASYVYDVPSNQVKVTATFDLLQQVIPAAEYAEMQKYLENVVKSQNRKLVIRKKA